MLDEKTDLLDRIMWIVLCEQMSSFTVETAINVSKEAKEQGLWEICKSYIMEELRESARLMANQMVGVNHEAEELHCPGCRSEGPLHARSCDFDKIVETPVKDLIREQDERYYKTCNDIGPEDEDNYPKPTGPAKHTGCMFGDILK